MTLREAVIAHPIRAYLIAKGLIFAAIGLSWWLAPSEGRLAGIEWFPGLTLWMVAVIWCAGGGLAIWAGVTGRHYRAGFAGLQGSAFFMALVFMVAAVLAFIPDRIFPGGEPRSVITAISYLGFWISAVIVAQIHPATEVVVSDDG